jgi:hypothetical protein
MSWRRLSQPTASTLSLRAHEVVQGGLPHKVASTATPGEERIAPTTTPDSPPRYGRAQFVQDAAWLGLDAQSAFSRVELRRQRDRLMSEHHPDRGGAEEMAVRINETYERMAGWLAKRRFRREGRRLTELESLATKPGEAPAAPRSVSRSVLSIALQIGAIQLSALALMAAVGYTTFRRRRP